MIRKLLRSIGEYRRDCILTPLFVVIEVIMEVLIPLVMAEMIDAGITGGNAALLKKQGAVLIILVLAGLLAGVLSGSFAANASAGFAKNLRQDMYDNIQNFSFTNIDKFSTSSIVTRLTTDVTNVQLAFMMIIRIAVRSPFMLVFSLIAAFSVNARLSFIFLAAIPILAIGLYLIVHFSHPYFEKVFTVYDDLNGVVQENLNGIRVVKSFVREDYEKKKFSKVSETIYKIFSKAEKIVAFNMPLMQVVVYACMLFFSWFGARLIVLSNATEMTTGELSSMIAYAMSILTCLMMLSMVLVMINMARSSTRRIVEILDEKSTITNKEDAVQKVAGGDIVFDHVGFSYGDDKEKECLHDLNLTVQAGSTLGIIGGTGTGKSSMVQLIARLYDATEGAVLVGGVNVKDYDLYALRNQVAMVLQKNELFSGTIKENLRWGNEHASDEQIVHACRLAQADSFIETFPDQYDTYIEQGGTNVSGGQKQRLCIARALLKNPKILILDDSTSAVDTKTDAMIRRAFREEIPDTTKIIIAQRISSVQDADKIVVMSGGRIDGCGTHEELLENNKIYREIYESQTKQASGDAGCREDDCRQRGDDRNEE
ncbi:Probable multidrug resistance ABC transporter ATP-binding/permease protein YheI [uncultured Roseburia sp.]|uniref:ABC transporter ATP-binding protein/permease n=1 Tax=Brotonthovivens ammoniilytica TaxID=2981725 RepID=A0ABT2TGP8_9FIRM|nr:ABC transporter ATP-binding protein [Brotonthovivens ammoniilytica]MCU6760754.1 ABC transporter ATP-binding protein/permease [Brotonthovivens ammoniilytica]SCI08203.1 Probable multidrug resistance ABC transporter ATP-binding/permease protein YheI [uncultured Roseburia sp.]